MNMSRSLLHDWEYAIEKCCRENNQTGMIDIAEDIYNTAYVRGKNHSVKVKEALDEQMNSSEKQPRWIPVSESMPLIGQEVLVCDFDGDMYITYLHLNGTWGFEYCGNKIKNVVAWQELPLPYKAESEE